MRRTQIGERGWILTSVILAFEAGIISHYTTRSWCTWRVSNPQSVSYKETATYQLAATRTWCQRLNSNQLQPGYETGDYPLRLRWQKIGGGGGHRTRCIRLWRPTFFQCELHPHLSKINKKPGARPGPVHKNKYTQTLNTRLPK
jgi:hypothetical protein